MRPPLLLTGPPAAGKSSTALALARSSARGAMIDVDDVRHLVVAGHAAPWDGDEGLLQQQIGVDNACAIARRFRRAEIDVVLADFVTDGTAARYRRQLPDLEIIRLQVSVAEGRRRAQLRPTHLTEREFAVLYDLEAASTFLVDHAVDVTDLESGAQIEAVQMLWRNSGPAPR